MLRNVHKATRKQHDFTFTKAYHCLNCLEQVREKLGIGIPNIVEGYRRRFSSSGAHLKFVSDESNILQASAFQHWFKNWQEKRKHKLTASTFASAIGFWPKRRVQIWLEKIGAIEPFSGSLATCWNNIKEQEALERYKLITGNSVLFPDFQVYHERSPDDDWLAASPDGLVYESILGSSSRGVLEIKCPFFSGDMRRAYPWKRIPLYYIPQAQGLMEIMDIDWIDVYCWTPNGSSLFRMDRDEEYWHAMRLILSEFWWKNVQPARDMYLRSTKINPLWELRMFRPTSRHELCNYVVFESKRLVDNSKLLMYEVNGKLVYSWL